MAPPAGDGGSPAPIDRSILDYLRGRLNTTQQVQRTTITDANGHLQLRVQFAAAYYPETVLATTLSVRWYTNDDFKIHYREAHDGSDWECRWDRHPNPHNTRNHFHPPPDAPMPGEDASWPTDYREVLTLVLDECEQRISTL